MENLHNYLSLTVEGGAKEYQIFTERDWPKQSPWADYMGMSAQALVGHVFNPLTNHLPLSVQSLKDRCRETAVLFANEEWYLLYIIEDGDPRRGQVLIGGAPQNESVISIVMQANGWEMPDELTKFCQVHNGFGVLWPIHMLWNSDCVLPNYRLRLLSEFFSNEEEEELSYEPENLLEFFPDGAGNGQFFYRSEQKSDVRWTVDWDHETRVLSKEENFWEFVDSQIYKMMN